MKKLEERIHNHKSTIECGNIPYLDVNISSLIDDVDCESINQNSTAYQIRDQIFISYSHKDQEWLQKFQTHLSPLIRNQRINVWTDTQIKVGANWKKEIDRALAAAKVAVLLVSPNFLASSFIANHELPPLLNDSKRKGLKIIWIPISYCLYNETEIVNYQSAQQPDQPLDSLNSSEQNRAWVNICEKVRMAAIA